MLAASPPIAPTTDAVIIRGDLGRLAHQQAPLAGAWAGCVPIASLSPTPTGMVTPSRPATDNTSTQRTTGCGVGPIPTGDDGHAGPGDGEPEDIARLVA